MSTTKKQGRKKAPQVWQSEEPIDTEGKKVQFIAQCSKWLKGNVVGSTRTGTGMNPYRHPTISATSVQSPICGILMQPSYEFFPISETIQVTCTFCKTPLPHVQHYFKNNYTRLPWTPMCAACHAKPEF